MTWRVGAARDLRIIERDTWDGQAAQNNIFAWAGWDDDPEPVRARRGFLVYDDDDPSLKGSYKLPFADVVDEELVAVDAGLRAAASRLPQTDIPDDVQDRARAVLDTYFERMEGEGEEANVVTLRTFPARVARRAIPLDARQALLGDYEFGDTDPYVFSAEISNDRLDAYYTHMDKQTTLPNFRDDAKAGVSLLDSHDAGKLGMGHTLDATFEDTGEVARVLADIYTVPGIHFGGQHSFASTDDFIRAVQAGIVRDVSVGFYGGSEICDVCGDPVWGWPTDCPHIPGIEYPIGNQGESTVLATATIVDAHLAEVSAVYDGATPQAMILDKATRLWATGELSARQVGLLERRYRVRLSDRQRLWQGAKVNNKGGSAMGKTTAGQATPAPEQANAPGQEQGLEREVAQLRGILSEADVPAEYEGRPVGEAVRWLMGEYSRLQPLEAEVERLRPLADIGRQYRQDLIGEALAEGVRAFGSGFAQERYRALLESNNTSLDMIKQMLADWRQLAARRFPGGRQTVDDDETSGNGQRSEPAVPDVAYTG